MSFPRVYKIRDSQYSRHEEQEGKFTTDVTGNETILTLTFSRNKTDVSEGFHQDKV